MGFHGVPQLALVERAWELRRPTKSGRPFHDVGLIAGNEYQALLGAGLTKTLGARSRPIVSLTPGVQVTLGAPPSTALWSARAHTGVAASQ